MTMTPVQAIHSNVERSNAASHTDRAGTPRPAERLELLSKITSSTMILSGQGRARYVKVERTRNTALNPREAALVRRYCA